MALDDPQDPSQKHRHKCHQQSGPHLIPDDWQGIKNMPLVWLRKVIPPKYQLLVICILVGFPLALAAWKLLSSGDLKPTVSPPRISFLARPHYDMPYGYTYFHAANGELKRVRSFPLTFRDMHARLLESQSSRRPTGVIREAYRVTIGNPCKTGAVVTGITLRVIDYDILPKRYVSSWHRKGIREAERVDFQLTAETKSKNLLLDSQYVELGPNETFILLANVTSADPGIYKFQFEAAYTGSNGKSGTWRSTEFSLFVPANDKHGTNGVSVSEILLERAYASRILRMHSPFYDRLRQETNPLSWILSNADKAESRSTLKLDDEQFLKVLREWRKNEIEMRKRKTSVKDIDRMSVEYLIANGDVSQAIRKLRDHTSRYPTDTESLSKLMFLLLKTNSIDSAHELWRLFQDDTVRQSEYYYLAGLWLSYYLHDSDMSQRLLRESAMLYPDSLLLLTKRTEYYAGHSDWNQALESLRVFFHLSMAFTRSGI